MTCVITDPGHPEWDAPNSGYCTSGGVCSEDTDGNGAINVNDLLNVLSDFGSSSPQNGGDVNADGLINVTDLLQVLSRFGASCAVGVVEPQLYPGQVGFVYPDICVHCTTHTCPEGQYEVLATTNSNSQVPIGCPTCEILLRTTVAPCCRAITLSLTL